ncbi:Hypothetical protein R9X50_00235800 [Acrodontium crateriforme]|uniref:Mid2 domain-containing protein n=1 Tax=Acrodontium crateriforme TaxID=150365 RepID=A0AAQ3M224_9PEZI|nr:Hypothetical protein R9X50_00235800 [Acrodontium crateriforme]
MASFTRSFVAFFLLATIFHFNPNTAHAQNCYYPNGDLSTEGDAACSSDGGFCCPLNWACLSNGLCYLENEDYYGRYTCTDQSWQSNSCSQICTQGDTASGNEAILQCTDGSWCCDGDRSFNCCSTADTEYFSLPQGSQIAFISSVPSPTSVVQTQSTSSTSTTSTSSTTSTIDDATLPTTQSSSFTTISSSTEQYTTTTQQSTSTNSDGSMVTVTIVSTALVTPSATTAVNPITSTISKKFSHKNTGLIIGLAVGIPIALISLAIVCILVWRNFRRSQNPSTLSPDNSMTKYHDPNFATSYGHFPPDGRASELDSHPVAPTRSKSGRASELLGSSVFTASPPFSPMTKKSSQRVSAISAEVETVHGLGLDSSGPGTGASPQMVRVNEEPVELWGGDALFRPLGDESAGSAVPGSGSDAPAAPVGSPGSDAALSPGSDHALSPGSDHALSSGSDPAAAPAHASGSVLAPAAVPATAPDTAAAVSAKDDNEENQAYYGHERQRERESTN